MYTLGSSSKRPPPVASPMEFATYSATPTARLHLNSKDVVYKPVQSPSNCHSQHPSTGRLKSSRKHTDLKAKCDSLKKENQELLSLLAMKNKQVKSLEGQVKQLEKEFLHFKKSYEPLLSSLDQTPPPSSAEAMVLVEKTCKVLKLIKQLPDLSQALRNNGFSRSKLKEYVSSNQLPKALMISLQLNSDLLLNARTSIDPDSSNPEDSLNSLTRESQYLLASINKQSSRISKIILESDYVSPRGPFNS